MANKKAKIIISAVISIFISVFLVSVSIYLLASFELKMIPKLIIPILIVFLPTWIFVYYALYKRKK
ncbi:MAG: hypothetical protein FWG85_05935 [Bacteroidetes bacterium]|nr:hypothetical protein [Bacteroidota bacterium]